MKRWMEFGRRSASRNARGTKTEHLRKRNLSPQPRVRQDPVSRSLRGRRSTPLSRPVRVAGLSGFFLVALAVGIATSATVSRGVARWWADAPTRVHSIAVLGHRHLEAAQVASATRLVRSAFLENLNASAIARDLAGHAWIESANVVPLPSGQVLVRIEERDPSATLHSGDATGVMWVDASGTPFAPADEEHQDFATRVRLVTTQKFAPGEAHRTLANAVALSQHLAPRTGLRRVSAEIQLPDPGDPRHWVLRSRNGELEAVLGAWEPPKTRGNERFASLETRLTRLERVLAADLSQAATSGRIDLRFKDQAIWVADDSPTGGRQTRD
ncbi:MAG: FtsQ-type POTRA domain-containing protein [Myxococcota bacterium]